MSSWEHSDETDYLNSAVVLRFESGSRLRGRYAGTLGNLGPQNASLKDQRIREKPICHPVPRAGSSCALSRALGFKPTFPNNRAVAMLSRTCAYFRKKPGRAN